MKIKEGYLLREVAGQYLVVPIEKAALTFNGIITLNKTGKFIWEILVNEVQVDDVIQKLFTRFDVSYDQAKHDVETFLSTLQTHSLLE